MKNIILKMNLITETASQFSEALKADTDSVPEVRNQAIGNYLDKIIKTELNLTREVDFLLKQLQEFIVIIIS